MHRDYLVEERLVDERLVGAAVHVVAVLDPSLVDRIASPRHQRPGRPRSPRKSHAMLGLATPRALTVLVKPSAYRPLRHASPQPLVDADGVDAFGLDELQRTAAIVASAAVRRGFVVCLLDPLEPVCALLGGTVIDLPLRDAPVLTAR